MLAINCWLYTNYLNPKVTVVDDVNKTTLTLHQVIISLRLDYSKGLYQMDDIEGSMPKNWISKSINIPVYTWSDILIVWGPLLTIAAVSRIPRLLLLLRPGAAASLETIKKRFPISGPSKYLFSLARWWDDVLFFVRYLLSGTRRVRSVYYPAGQYGRSTFTWFPLTVLPTNPNYRPVATETPPTVSRRIAPFHTDHRRVRYYCAFYDSARP